MLIILEFVYCIGNTKINNKKHIYPSNPDFKTKIRLNVWNYYILVFIIHYAEAISKYTIRHMNI